MTEPSVGESASTSRRPRTTTRWLVPRAAGLLFVLVVAVLFVVENQDEVRTHFVFFTVTAKIWIGFLVCLVLGAILGQAATGWWRRRASHRRAGRR